MFTKATIAGCAAVVLAIAFGSVAQARSNSVEWWRAYQTSGGKGCIRGEQSASSAYPAWAVCVGRVGDR